MRQLIQKLSRSFVECEALIVSDYGYGMTAGLIESITKLQHLAAYRQLKAIAVKPNYKEATGLLGLEVLPTPSLSQRQTRANQIVPYTEKRLELTGAQIVTVTYSTGILPTCTKRSHYNCRI